MMNNLNKFITYINILSKIKELSLKMKNMDSWNSYAPYLYGDNISYYENAIRRLKKLINKR